MSCMSSYSYTSCRSIWFHHLDESISNVFIVLGALQYCYVNVEADIISQLSEHKSADTHHSFSEKVTYYSPPATPKQNILLSLILWATATSQLVSIPRLVSLALTEIRKHCHGIGNSCKSLTNATFTCSRQSCTSTSTLYWSCGTRFSMNLRKKFVICIPRGLLSIWPVYDQMANAVRT